MRLTLQRIPLRPLSTSWVHYEVLGLPANRRIQISEIDPKVKPGRWHILPITMVNPDTGVKGKWTGNYESPEAALAAIDAAFLEDPAHWFIGDDE
jgi:hypothetical protein